MSKHTLGIIILFIISLLLILIFGFNANFFLFLLPFMLIWIIIVTWGSFSIQSNYHLNTICKIKTNDKLVALSFDDGPTEYTNKILELLHKYGCKASFFCIGTQMEKHPNLLRKILAEGHVIGNHTYTHANSMGFKSTAKIITEIKQTDDVAFTITGKKTKYFRPPFGVTNPQIRKAIKVTKQTVIGWNIRSLDTVIKDENKIYQRIMRKFGPGSIILMHDTSSKTINVLERLLQTMQEKNYTSVTVDELLKLKK